MGYAQVQVEHALGGYISYEDVGLVYEEAYGSTSLASNIDTYDIDEYASWSNSGSTPKLFCNLDDPIFYNNDYVNSYLLTLKATAQTGYVFDHWEVVGSTMDLSQFANIATPEATIELCDSNNQNKPNFDLHASYRAVFRPLAAPPTPAPVPTVTPPGNDNGDGGGNTTTPSAPQCQATKPDDPAPYITHATSGGPGSITLHYQLGGKPYTKYLVEYGYANAGFTFGTTVINPEAGNITINDLNPGTTYQFRLIPANDCAVGTPSNIFPVAVGGLPKVPGVPNTGYKRVVTP